MNTNLLIFLLVALLLLSISTVAQVYTILYKPKIETHTKSTSRIAGQVRSNLDENEKVIVYLLEQGNTFGEIAQHTGYSEASIRQRWTEIRRKMGGAIEESNYYCKFARNECQKLASKFANITKFCKIRG